MMQSKRKSGLRRNWSIIENKGSHVEVRKLDELEHDSFWSEVFAAFVTSIGFAALALMILLWANHGVH